MVEPSPVTPERLAKLREIGLTDYQARTYLAALAAGAATARELATLSTVPRPKMYETLESLVGKGLIEAVLGKPTRYRAVPVETYLAALAEDHRNKATTFEGMRESLAQIFRPAEGEMEEAGVFRYFKGRRSIHAKVGAMAQDAKREVLLVGTELSAQRILRSVHATLQARAVAGVKVRILLPVTAENAEAVETLGRRAEVRHLERRTGTFSILADGHYALLTREAEGMTSRGEEVGVWTDDKAVVRLVSESVDALWDAAVPASDKLRELATGEAPERVELVRDPARAAGLLSELAATATRSLLVATSELGVYQLQSVRAMLKAKAASGLRVRVLLPVTPNNRGVVQGLVDVAEVRHADALPGRFVVADGKAALVTDPAAKDTPFLDKEAFAANTLHARHRGYAAMLEQLFEDAWARAEPAEGRLKK